MKNFLKLLLWGIPLTLLIYCISIFGQRSYPELPSFNLLLSDSTTVFNTSNIPEGKPSILLFFSPGCDHCQNETASLLKNMDSLRTVNFYFISIDAFSDLKSFTNYYKLFQYSNITVGRDYTFYFLGYFKGAIPPYLVIYDSNKRQRAVFSGQTEAQKIISYLKQI